MVSVIIPTYNREKTLRRSIDSVLSQSYRDLELIISDDCSTDRTRELVESIEDPRVRYVRLEKNSGACAARNAGIDAAKGEWIAFQDSDDSWLPGKLERQLEVLEETKADVCFHKLRRHYRQSGKIKYFPRPDESGFMTHRQMCNEPMISTQTIIGKREVFEEHRFDPKVKKAQDYDWGIRASQNHSIYYLNEVLAEQYFQDDSISAKGLRTVIQMRQYFLEKYPEECRENPQFEIYQLQIIARSKALAGEDPTAEYRRIYQMRKRKSDLAKVLLSRAGLMKTVYHLKGRKNESLAK